MLAGLGGAYLPLAYVNTFTDTIISNRGWIALSIVILGNWNAYGILGSCLLFGLVDAIQLRLQAVAVGIPYEFLLMQPYLLAITVLVLAARRAGVPAALGKPYRKD